MLRIVINIIINLLFILTIVSTVVVADPVSDVFAAAFFGTCCLIYLFLLVIWIVVGIWVYKDAESRGKNGALWLLIVILLGLIGIIIWLIIRPPQKTTIEEATKEERRCPNCGRIIPLDAGTCPYCSKKFW